MYMQTARPIIADDLGPEVAKGAVSAEGVRRWNAMIAPDKQVRRVKFIITNLNFTNTSVTALDQRLH